MNEAITQWRLSIRLDVYLKQYLEKYIQKDHFSRQTWAITWDIADAARLNQELTPELVDDVRMVLKQLEATANG